MGEMADYANSDYGFIWPSSRRKQQPKSTTCQYCGKKNLKWKQTENGWRLTFKGKVHKCKQIPKILYRKDGQEFELKEGLYNDRFKYDDLMRSGDFSINPPRVEEHWKDEDDWF